MGGIISIINAVNHKTEMKVVTCDTFSFHDEVYLSKLLKNKNIKYCDVIDQLNSFSTICSPQTYIRVQVDNDMVTIKHNRMVINRIRTC